MKNFWSKCPKLPAVTLLEYLKKKLRKNQLLSDFLGIFRFLIKSLNKNLMKI
jgi:hypothetical protein